MNHVFNEQLREFALVFNDNILAYSKTWEEHIQQLDEVLSILAANSHFAKASKCEFKMTELLYLGYFIGNGGVKACKEKIQAILDWPSPKNMSQLRGFIDLCIYYRRLVKGFSSLTTPLTNLTKKDAFVWTDDSQRIIDHI